MMRAALAPLLACLPLLAGCGPVPVAQAERMCLDEALLAERPRGTIAAGMSSTGRPVGGIALQVSSDYLLGRDPEQVWQSCVMNRSGQLPTRPYAPVRN